MEKTKVAIIINSSLGWRSIRNSWTRELAHSDEFVFVFLALENYRDHVPAWVRGLKRFSSVSEIFMGRAAAKDAIRQGCTKIVIATLHNAGALPLPQGVKYYIYGDATVRQLDSFGYYHADTAQLPLLKRVLNSFIRFAYKGVYDVAVRKLVKRGDVFLCMSQWYADGLVQEFPGMETQVRILPGSIDTRHWVPSPDGRSSNHLTVLFLGGDLERKGGDLVLAACRMPEFKDLQFNFVTRTAPNEVPGNAAFFTGMQSNSKELVELVQSSDLLVLPTRADCSPIVALECAAVGLPAVINNIAGVPELVKHNVTGILLKDNSAQEVAAAIRFYNQDREALRAHGSAARSHVSANFDIKATMEKLLTYLRE